MNHKSLRVAALTLALASAHASAAQFRTIEPSAGSVADTTQQLIVRYRSSALTAPVKLQAINAAASRARMMRANDDAGATPATARIVRRLGIGADVLRFSRRLGDSELQAVMTELRNDPNVEWVDVNRMLRHTGLPVRRMNAADPAPVTPNDQHYAKYQWHLHNAVGGINAPLAWNRATGTGVVVAVLDTGIVAHPDLDANILPGYDFITLPEISRRPTAERVPGGFDLGDWNVDGECNGSPAEDSSWHGSHVTGTIAEVTNNTVGMAGVAFDAKVVPVRVLGKCGGQTIDIADAIVWASGGSVPGVPANPNPAEVINLSLGGRGTCGAATQTAIDGAVSRGTIVVVAAGNSNADAANYTPASCRNVITVAATGVTGARASYSNFGSTIEVAGPGGGGSVDGNPNGYIWQSWLSSPTSPDQGQPSYVGMGGTSMASPHVAGVVALIQSVVKNPLKPAEIETLLKASTRPFPMAPDQVIGPGLLDAKLALDNALNPAGPPAIKLTSKVAVNISGAAGGNGVLYSIDVAEGARLLNVMTYAGSGDVTLYLSKDQAPTSTQYQLKSARPGTTETLRVIAPAKGTYYVRVVGEAAYANVSLQARVD